MGRKPQWIVHEVVDGVGEIEITSWKYFNTYICDEMLDFRHYIWRGQKDYSWKLEPTLDRILKEKKLLDNPNGVITRHLERFKFSTQGRRGINPQKIENENDWWALGQHNGLATPLLDWSRSPYVASYFAVCEDGAKNTNKRTIYAISPSAIDKVTRKIKQEYKGKGRPPIVEFITPLTDENQRLVNQNGLFSRSPTGIDLETWVRNNFVGLNNEYILMKLTIPEKDRIIALRTLNRMNINHLTLFPDLYGASKTCNMDLLIEKY